MGGIFWPESEATNCIGKENALEKIVEGSPGIVDPGLHNGHGDVRGKQGSAHPSNN
jgi:hypothetical protein